MRKTFHNLVFKEILNVEDGNTLKESTQIVNSPLDEKSQKSTKSYKITRDLSVKDPVLLESDRIVCDDPINPFSSQTAREGPIALEDSANQIVKKENKPIKSPVRPKLRIELNHQDSEKTDSSLTSLRSHNSVSPTLPKKTQRASIFFPGTSDVKDSLLHFTNNTTVPLQSMKRRASLFRSLVKEEENMHGSVFFDRKFSVSSSNDRMSIASERKGSYSFSLKADSEERKRSIFRSNQNSVLYTNMEPRILDQLPTQPPQLLGDDIIRKLSLHKSSFSKNSSMRDSTVTDDEFTISEIDASFRKKFNFKERNTYFNKKQTQGVILTKNFASKSEDANLFINTLSELSSPYKKDDQGGSPLLAYRSLIADVKGNVEKQKTIDLSTLLQRYDENSPTGGSNLIKQSSNKTLYRVAPPKKDTKLLIQVLSPKFESGSKEQEVNCEDRKYEFTIPSEIRKIPAPGYEYSVFDTLEEIEAKEFNPKVYLGQMIEPDDRLIWNFDKYFSRGHASKDFFEYYEHIILKKFPFLVIIYDEKCKKYEESIISQISCYGCVKFKLKSAIGPIKYVLTTGAHLDLKEGEKVVKEATKNFYAHQLLQSQKSQRCLIPANKAKIPIDNSISREPDLSNLDVRDSLPKQPEVLKVSRVITFQRMALLLGLSEEVLERYNKENNLELNDYFAMTDLNSRQIIECEPEKNISKIIKNTNESNLNLISFLMFTYYDKMLGGRFESCQSMEELNRLDLQVLF